MASSAILPMLAPVYENSLFHSSYADIHTTNLLDSIVGASKSIRKVVPRIFWGSEYLLQNNRPTSIGAEATEVLRTSIMFYDIKNLFSTELVVRTTVWFSFSTSSKKCSMSQV